MEDFQEQLNSLLLARIILKRLINQQDFLDSIESNQLEFLGFTKDSIFDLLDTLANRGGNLFEFDTGLIGGHEVTPDEIQTLRRGIADLVFLSQQLENFLTIQRTLRQPPLRQRKVKKRTNLQQVVRRKSTKVPAKNSRRGRLV